MAACNSICTKELCAKPTKKVILLIR
jgi:hypothetical protein